MTREDIPILRTKLHRPLVGGNVVARPQLLEQLNQGIDQPLTLVSAPAGFGKSTLVSQWLETLKKERNCCWFSVDQADDSLSVFLLYLVTAIRQSEPDACPQSMQLAQQGELPEVSMVARVLINEILDLKKSVVFVVDDFHHLCAPSIHDFLTTLLSYPPPNFHWVVLTRKDPDLALNKLRMVGSIQELRLDDLRFSGDEIRSYLSQVVDGELPQELIVLAEERLEGWAAALQLLAVAMRKGRGDLTEKMPSAPAQISAYLIEEILKDLSLDYREIVIRMSLFDRFTSGLTSAVMPDAMVDGFYTLLMQTNLFVINRDQEEGWFCFHPFFQDALLQMLNNEVTADDIKLMRQRAAAWYAEQGMVQDSIAQAMLCGDALLAGKIVEGCLQMSEWQGDYNVRDRWLGDLPSEVIDESPILLVGEAWKEYRANVDWISAMKRAEASVKKSKLDESSAHWVNANLACLRCAYHHTKREFQKAVKAGTGALELLSSTQTHLRATTVGMLSLSYRSNGQNAEALQVIREGREQCQSDSAALGVIHIADCHRYLMSMDMPGLQSSAEYCWTHCEKHQLLSIGDVARILAGYACYQMNDLAQAELYLARTDLELARMDFRNVIWSQGYLALTYAAQDRWQDADQLISQLINEVRNRPNRLFLEIVESLQAEFGLRRGRVSKAQRWIDQCEAPECESKVVNQSPVAGYVRVLLTLNDKPSRKKALSMIEAMRADAQSACLTEVQVQCLILKALWHSHGGADRECQASLGDAVRMAQHGGALRIFADFGVELMPLLQKLRLNTEELEYVGCIVKAMNAPAQDKAVADAVQIQSTVHMPLMESLSKREFEVLLLLAKHCSNNDISDQLFISLGTVKRHVSNIYEKLAVHGRKEAVAKAVGLGLIKS